jgi:phage gp36-like protein
MLYGAGFVTVACDRNVDGSLDTASFEYHLQVASDQIDGYLLGRYNLPLATPPAIFVKVCVDLAIYNACPTADVLTNEIRDRNKAALEYMRDIAANRVKLIIAPSTTEPNRAQHPQIDTQVEVRRMLVTGSREFKTESLRRLLSGGGGYVPNFIDDGDQRD